MSSHILDQIVVRKKAEVARLYAQYKLADLEKAAELLQPCRGFAAALQTKVASGGIAIIAEIKKASPSKGLLRADFNPAAISQSYAKAGACCLSVLTDVDFFQGADEYLQQAHQACTLPIIRKDFIIDRIQIARARLIGADCVLLIAAILTADELALLHGYALELGLDVLVEVHNRIELEMVNKLAKVLLIGINNRDLQSFDVDLNTSLSLQAQALPEALLISESGINSRADIAKLRAANIHSFLIGESFMRAQDPGQKLAELLA